MKSPDFLFPALFVCILFITACEKRPLNLYEGEGLKPEYISLDELYNIQNLPEQPVNQSGPIFLKDDLFFMLETRKGIHVYDVSDPEFPSYLTFFSIPAIGDFSIFDNRLYADSWRDLVTVDISDIFNIVEINRQQGIFTPLLYPPLYNGHFECIDETKGAVAGWEETWLTDARCRTIN